MKAILKTAAILSAAALALSLVSCSTEELDTAQYSSSEVTLASFGPNPVMRGAILRFFGSNLDRIVEVNVPGIEPLTDINVITTGYQSEIQVWLPDDGPEVGTVTLKSSDGKVFTTTSELTYTEPIVLESFTANEVNYPGDVVIIEGDYMNLVMTATCEGAEAVEVDPDTRYRAIFVIPENAVTGKFFVSDEGEVANIIYSEEDLVIGDPTVSSATAREWKPDETVTISGKYLDMINEVRLAGDVTVSHENFNYFYDEEVCYQISFYLPAEAQSGDIVCVSYAGKEFTAGTAEMVKPTGLAVAPSPVKAGQELTISGEDLDIVTTVNFPNSNGATFTLSSGSLKVTVPAAAQEGDISLVMANGDAVTVPYTLVHPTVTSIDPTELVAGETITIQGTDLDLITGVTLGDKDETFTCADGVITVTTQATSVSGQLVLSLANGETLNPTEAITVSYDSYIIITDMPEAEHIGAIVTFKGSNFMMIENIYIGDAKVTSYVSRTDNEISFIMPYNPIGTYSIYFDLLNGERETYPTQIEVLLELDIIDAWEGNMDITWSEGERVVIPASKFEGVKAGAKIRFYFTQKDGVWAQAQINDGSWGGIIFPEIGQNTLVPTDVYGWFSDGILDRCFEATLTADILAQIEANKADCDGVTNAGIIIQGQELIFTKVEIVSEISQEMTLWEGLIECGSWGSQGITVNWSLAEDGQRIRVYFNVDDPSYFWQIKFYDGHWGGLYVAPDGTDVFSPNNCPSALSDGYVSFDLIPAVYAYSDWGYNFIPQGDGVNITKITCM